MKKLVITFDLLDDEKLIDGYVTTINDKDFDISDKTDVIGDMMEMYNYSAHAETIIE